jgi:hypothetical protein
MVHLRYMQNLTRPIDWQSVQLVRVRNRIDGRTADKLPVLPPPYNALGTYANLL